MEAASTRIIHHLSSSCPAVAAALCSLGGPGAHPTAQAEPRQGKIQIWDLSAPLQAVVERGCLNPLEPNLETCLWFLGTTQRKTPLELGCEGTQADSSWFAGCESHPCRAGSGSPCSTPQSLSPSIKLASVSAVHPILLYPPTNLARCHQISDKKGLFFPECS